MVGAVILALMCLGVIVGPWLWPVAINDIDFAATLQGPSPNHPFGTDDLGQDLLARMIYGGRISLAVGFAAMIISTLVGVLVGAIAGLMVEAGNGRGFVELVTAHGVLELTCVVVAGAAGLRLGWSIVEPGRLPRRVSLLHEARRSVALVIGTAPWLVLAGFVEGFVSPEGIGMIPALIVGGAIAAGFLVGRITSRG
jgi:ABC-type dipeptide/oligopeptide/nickel transport system permease subunit